MFPISLGLVGITRAFPSLPTLDLSTLPVGALVAVTGPNGAGKTTLMDTLSGFASLWRELSSKPGGLKEYATSRAASIDLSFAYRGHVYRSLINVDPDYSAGRGKEEAFLYEDGVALCNGRVTDYDNVVCGIPAKDGVPGTPGLFPPKSVYLASAFSAQDRRGNFFSLTPPERKALFAELLGLGALQATAERAKVARARLDAAVEQLDADAERVLLDWGRAKSFEAGIADGTAALAPLLADEATAERDLHAAVDAGQAAVGLLQQLDTARRVATDRRAELDAEIATADRDVAATETTIRDLEILVLDSVAIRSRAAVLATAREAKRTAAARWEAATVGVRAARSARDATAEAQTRAAADVGRAELVISAAEKATAELPALEKRLAPLAQARIDHGRIDAEVRAEEVALAPMRTNARNEAGAADIRLREARAALETATAKAGLLDGVPCRGAVVTIERGDLRNLPDRFDDRKIGAFLGPDEILDVNGVGPAIRPDCGSCRFLTDARLAADSIEERTARVAELRTAKATADAALDAATARDALLTDARSRRDALARTIAELSPLEARAATLRAQTAGVAAAEFARAEASARVVALAAQIVTHAAALTQAEADRAIIGTEGQDADRVIGAHAGADTRLQSLDAAEARLPDLREKAETARNRSATATRARAAVVVPPEPAAQRIDAEAANVRTRAARLALQSARDATTAARSALDIQRGQLVALGDVDYRKAEVDRRRLAISMRRSGFVLVEQAFGRNGIQALEIDAAGPEVSTLTNELLAVAFGPRFAINLRTIQEAGGGLRQKEVFDVLVTDSARTGPAGCKPGPFESFSVGEKTLIDEALKLAIVLFNARRHGGQFETLWRDEPDAGLSDEMATNYPAMLRRALEIGGFRNAFFSSHRPASAAQADAFIRVGDGRAILEMA